jgi:hypothetical protein
LSINDQWQQLISKAKKPWISERNTGFFMIGSWRFAAYGFPIMKIYGESAQDFLANMELDKLNTFLKALMPVQSNLTPG